jgi:hypothetical protein
MKNLVKNAFGPLATNQFSPSVAFDDSLQETS